MFDPYHKWLGIPPAEQPPDHYRLLGLARFEADREVIGAAANRQMAYLQGCATGPHVLLSQRLLNEVAAARLTLLSPDRKARYDAGLMPPASADLPAQPPLVERNDETDEIWGASTGPLPATRLATRRWRSRSLRTLLIICAGTAALIAMALGGRVLRRPAPAPPAVIVPPIPEVVAIPPDPPAEPKRGAHESTQSPPAKVAIPRSTPVPVATTKDGVAPLPESALPKIPFYPENRFLPLFHGEMIDHTPTNQSNCWLDERFTQFVLRLQFRLRSHASNPWSGVRLRHGSDDARVSLVLYEGACGGLLVDRSPPGLHPGLIERPLEGDSRLILPARREKGLYGSWNDCEVMCAGGETTVAINGVVVNHIRDGAGGPGLVCLTGLEGDLAFRNVRLLDLTDRPTTAPSEAADAPQILHWRTNTWTGSPTDVAEVAENKVRVAMGSQDYGFGEAGCEVASVGTMKVDLNLSGQLRKLDDASVAAFVIDYRTAGGYTRRQFCPIGAKVARRNLPHPSWGKGTAPDGIAQLQLRKTYDIELGWWAPPGWDGTVWFSVLLQNTGRNTSMTATLRPVK